MTYKLSSNGHLTRSSDNAIIPEDVNNRDYQAFLEWKQGGNEPEPYVQTVAEIVAQYEKALDNHMDAMAKLYRYDNRYTFALRAGFEGPYHQEGKAFAIWMDECNFHGLELLNRCLGGVSEIPSIEEFLGSLPEFPLPVK